MTSQKATDYDFTMVDNVVRDVLCEITKGNGVTRDIHCDVTMRNDIAMYISWHHNA